MANSQVIEADNVEQATRSVRVGLLSSPLVQVALLTGIIFVGTTAVRGLEFGLRLALMASIGPVLGLLARRWWDRARNRQSLGTGAEQPQGRRRRNVRADVSAIIMTLGALFAIVTALYGLESATRVMAPIALPMPVVFLAWYWQSRQKRVVRSDVR